MRQLCRVGRKSPDLQWLADYVRMMEATMVAFCVGGFFLNRGYLNLLYHCFALVSAAAARHAPVVAVGQRATGQIRVTVRASAAAPTAVQPAAATNGSVTVWRRRDRWC